MSCKYIARINRTVLILTVCDSGWYGLNCMQRCIGLCLNNVSCNHVNGQCDGGCAYGWHGQYCNETCIGHCINNATCNQETGLCDGGCDAGWSGYTCDEGKVFTKQDEISIKNWLPFAYIFICAYLLSFFIIDRLMSY